MGSEESTVALDQPERDDWDNVEPLDDETDTRDVYIVCVADADSDSGTHKKDAYLAFTDENAKFQAFHAVKDSYGRPKVYHCEKVAKDV